MQSRVAPVVRAGAFVRKEIVEVVRQPRLLASLVLGPFLILLLFGVGYQAVRPLDMYVVASEDDFLGQAVIDWAENSGQAVTVVGTGSDEAEGLRLLESGDVDAVIVVPPSPLETIQQNEKAEFLVIHDELDPFERTAIDFFARTSVDQANDRLLSELAEEGIEVGISEGSEYEGIDTEVLVAPFSASTEQVQGISVDVTSYYAPAVIVLLLQHAALTFAASLAGQGALPGDGRSVPSSPAHRWRDAVGQVHRPLRHWGSAGRGAGGGIGLCPRGAHGGVRGGSWGCRWPG